MMRPQNIVFVLGPTFLAPIVIRGLAAAAAAGRDDHRHRSRRDRVGGRGLPLVRRPDQPDPPRRAGAADLRAALLAADAGPDHERPVVLPARAPASSSTTRPCTCGGSRSSGSSPWAWSRSGGCRPGGRRCSRSSPPPGSEPCTSCWSRSVPRATSCPAGRWGRSWPPTGSPGWCGCRSGRPPARCWPACSWIAGAVSQHVVLTGQVANAASVRPFLGKAHRLEKLGIKPPCALVSPSVAYYVGCTAPWSVDPQYTGSTMKWIFGSSDGGVQAWHRVKLPPGAPYKYVWVRRLTLSRRPRPLAAAPRAGERARVMADVRVAGDAAVLTGQVAGVAAGRLRQPSRGFRARLRPAPAGARTRPETPWSWAISPNSLRSPGGPADPVRVQRRRAPWAAR